jgi:hypothetical protein
MLTSEDYKQMANRSAKLAIKCAAPSVAEALMALALDYAGRAARLSEAAPRQQQNMGRRAWDGFGD